MTKWPVKGFMVHVPYGDCKRRVYMAPIWWFIWSFRIVLIYPTSCSFLGMSVGTTGLGVAPPGVPRGTTRPADHPA